MPSPYTCAIRALIPLAFVVGFPVLMVVLSVQRAQAAVIGWRIEARACQGPILCVDFPPSPKLWRGLYACQIRAENLRDLAELHAGLPADKRGVTFVQALGLPKGAYTFRVRCVPVEGLTGA